MNDYFYLPEGVYEKFFKNAVEVIVLEYSDTLLAYGGPLYDKNWHGSISSLFDDINYLLRFDLPIIILTEEHYLSELIPTVTDHYEKDGIMVFDIRFDDQLVNGIPMPKDMYMPAEFYEIDPGDKGTEDENQSSKSTVLKEQQKEDEIAEEDMVYVYFIVPFMENHNPITFEDYELAHKVRYQ